MEFLLCSLNVAVIGYGGYLVMQGQMDYRDLLTFTLYTASFIAPMRKLCNFSVHIVHFRQLDHKKRQD